MHDHVQSVGAVEACGIDKVVWGLSRKCWRSRKIPYGKAHEHKGNTRRPERVTQPDLGHHQILTALFVAERPTINVAMYTQNSTSRPGKSKRANAYAANTEQVNCIQTKMTAVINAVTAAPDPTRCQLNRCS